MIGTKLHKNIMEDMARYPDIAVWCNANNATIEEKGDYYEVVEVVIPEPTIEEKRNTLVRQYEADKAEIIKYITEAVAYGDDTDELREELLALDEQFDTDMEALKGDE